MPAKTDRVGLLDFGMGMLMGLVRSGERVLDERRLIDVHKGFVVAFQTVEAELGNERLRFWMTTGYHGTSPDVDRIFNYWLGTGYVTKDAPGTIYRFHLTKDEASERLETFVGGADAYDKAVTAFVDYMNTHHSS